MYKLAKHSCRKNVVSYFFDFVNKCRHPNTGGRAEKWKPFPFHKSTFHQNYSTYKSYPKRRYRQYLCRPFNHPRPFSFDQWKKNPPLQKEHTGIIFFFEFSDRLSQTGFPWSNSPKFPEIPRSSRNIPKVPRNSPKFPKSPQKFRKIHLNSLNFLEIFGNPLPSNFFSAFL